VRLVYRQNNNSGSGHELRDFIEYLIESGDYRTQSEVIRESLVSFARNSRITSPDPAEFTGRRPEQRRACGVGKGHVPEKLKQAQSLPVKNVKLTPKASQDLEDIWYYGYHHFR
jgi:hypothetical protein